MAENLHFRDLLHSFEKFAVEYLIVGGYAIMKYTEPHYTKDLDVWVRNSPENSRNVYDALAAFGAPLQKDGINPETFTSDNITYQIGVAPIRVDILTSIDGVRFADAWPNRVESTFLGLPVSFISLNDLIANKKAAGRASDLEHLEYIQQRQQNEVE